MNYQKHKFDIFVQANAKVASITDEQELLLLRGVLHSLVKTKVIKDKDVNRVCVLFLFKDTLESKQGRLPSAITAIANELDLERGTVKNIHSHYLHLIHHYA